MTQNKRALKTEKLKVWYTAWACHL